MTQDASSAKSSGLKRTAISPSRSGPGRVSVTVTEALAPLGFSSMRPLAITATIASIEAAKAVRATAREGSWRSRPAPSRLPSVPPASAATSAMIRPSGRMSVVQGIGITRCDQPHSAAKPRVPTAAPDTRPNAMGRLVATTQGDGLDQERLAEVERQHRGRLAHHGADEDADGAADEEEEGDCGDRAAAADPDARRGQGEGGAESQHRRLEHHPELRHAEVELGLVDGDADQQAAADADPSCLDGEALAVRCVAGLTLTPEGLGQQHPLPDQGHGGAAEQLQVGRAPERHVLAEDAVPDVVKRETDQGEAAAEEHEDAADGRVPIAAEMDRRGARALAVLGQEDREPTRGEDPHQAEQDRVVGDVGERPGVAALVDVDRDVPVHADEGRDQGDGGEAIGRAAEPGTPPTRSARSDAQARTFPLPAR